MISHRIVVVVVASFCCLAVATRAAVIHDDRNNLFSVYAASLATPTQQQYHSQDEFGQYAYGYVEPLSAKQEVRSLDGVTRGSYSYRDAEGKLQTVDYTAGVDGFRVAATNLPRPVAAAGDFRAPEAPVAVADTVEVAAARAAHLAAHEEARLRLSKGDTTGDESIAIDASDRRVELPQPVEDTDDVAAAKSLHLKRIAVEKQRNAILSAPALATAAIYRPAAALPVVATYSSAPLVPRIYGFHYPLAAARFYGPSFYY